MCHVLKETRRHDVRSGVFNVTGQNSGKVNLHRGLSESVLPNAGFCCGRSNSMRAQHASNDFGSRGPCTLRVLRSAC